jgi:hypothetical protein
VVTEVGEVWKRIGEVLGKVTQNFSFGLLRRNKSLVRNMMTTVNNVLYT